MDLKPLTTKEQLERIVRDLDLGVAPHDEALMVAALVLLKSHPDRDSLAPTIGQIFAQIQRRDAERDAAFIGQINELTTT